MYLKQIELQGFKSFVDHTVLDFTKSGITGIVGPNGSGKSNISDAVKWVLGEQSPKTLRGSKMEDMIFAGTQNRKPVGYAEVSLVFNNEDGALNIAYNEVKVTRRLFRSGESEYLINGGHCKLKDITILFADTGIGRDGYSIIGQGKIDEILSNKSEDRRSVFEDAAGISKYRMRKVEAEKKLESAQVNSDRVNDIINELSSQLEPLTKQAEKAKIFLSLKYELRDIEVGVLADQIRRATEHLEELIVKQNDLQAEITECDTGLEKIKEENTVKTEENKVLEEKLSSAKSKEFELKMEYDRLDSEIKLCRERIKTIDDSNEKSEREKTEYDGRISILSEKIEETAKSLISAEEELKAASDVLDEGQKKYDEIMALLSNDSQKAQQIRDEITEKKLNKTKIESGITALENQIKLVESRISTFNSTKSSLADEARTAEEDYNKLKNSVADEDRKLANLNSEKTELQNKYDSLNDRRDKCSEKLSDSYAALKEKSARLNVFKEYEKNLEGYGRSVKEILQLCRDNKNFGKGIYGAVSQLVTVSEKYELAIETALGGNYQNIITETEEDAKHAIEFLKENKFGRATFLPISASKGKILEPNIISELKKIPGYIGLATEVITVDNKFYDVIASLLGRTAVFDSIDSAIFASRKFGYSFTSVTTEGEILRTSGAITGGSSDSAKKTNTLGRTREIPELEKECKELNEAIEGLTQQKKDLTAEIEVVAGYIRGANTQIKSLEDKTADFYKKTAQAEEKMNFSVKRVTEIDKDIENEKAQAEESSNTILLLKADIDTAEKEIQSLVKELDELEQKTASGVKVRETMNNKLLALKIGKNDAENNILRLNDEKARLSEEIQLCMQKKSQFDSEKEESESIKKAFTDTIQSHTERRKEIEKELSGLAEIISDFTKQKNDLTEELSGMLEKLTAASEKSGSLKVEANRIENRIQKYNDEIDGCKTRLWEEYELTPTKAAEMSGNKPVENYAATQKRISELRNNIKALGSVNVSAIEDLEATQKRYEFLKEQKKDIDEAKEKALSVINEVTQVMKKQFAEQFVLIRSNFNEMFVKLFGGGKADIVLSDNTDLLGCNIDINVQPPGKKLQNMMLLSGGERALTAIALLFGILKLRPAPFCILDEIDSALDESNVGVYSNFMHNLTEDTQFIMITHRKGTMNVADTLYGVTMEEKGVSTILSLKV